ncbi:hypothetical protein DPMN_130312 [Dreissena polymorpha]|uniref:Uncharacterized protein n=1 Tax=Dreissena polymorpha TaxID=45954 RepID=A0A9D4H2R5_DREPO|nr:hypothetical protein DPMN_130312 [Dreissena polymorpha]
MDFSHERYPQAGHGRRASSTSIIGPIVRALPGLHLTVSSRPGPNNDLKATYSYPKAVTADGSLRRASSAPGSVPCGGAMDVSGLSCWKLNLSTTSTTHNAKTTEGYAFPNKQATQSL